jgi:hypothetical protein
MAQAGFAALQGVAAITTAATVVVRLGRHSPTLGVAAIRHPAPIHEAGGGREG